MRYREIDTIVQAIACEEFCRLKGASRLQSNCKGRLLIRIRAGFRVVLIRILIIEIRCGVEYQSVAIDYRGPPPSPFERGGHPADPYKSYKCLHIYAVRAVILVVCGKADDAVLSFSEQLLSRSSSVASAFRSAPLESRFCRTITRNKVAPRIE
jgi:hypothetical protein